MPSIIDDFDHIAMRLNEIVNAKQPKPEAKSADEQLAWDSVYGLTEDMGVYG